jgi:hypothetical protein
MQAADAIRDIRAARPGQRIRYFQSNNQTGLLMECRQRSNGSGQLSTVAKDADDIAQIAFGLAQADLGFLTQERLGAPGDYSFNYYIHVVREITIADIQRARTAPRPIIYAAA